MGSLRVGILFLSLVRPALPNPLLPISLSLQLPLSRTRYCRFLRDLFLNFPCTWAVSTAGRHASKVIEEKEDEECLKEEEDALAGAGGTCLVSQPSCIQGKMRDYQLAGLNWLLRLYENGFNGILVDEMALM